jgi:hypothetical protein
LLWLFCGQTIEQQHDSRSKYESVDSGFIVIAALVCSWSERGERLILGQAFGFSFLVRLKAEQSNSHPTHTNIFILLLKAERANYRPGPCCYSRNVYHLVSQPSFHYVSNVTARNRSNPSPTSLICSVFVPFSLVGSDQERAYC